MRSEYKLSWIVCLVWAVVAGGCNESSPDDPSGGRADAVGAAPDSSPTAHQPTGVDSPVSEHPTPGKPAPGTPESASPTSGNPDSPTPGGAGAGPSPAGPSPAGDAASASGAATQPAGTVEITFEDLVINMQADIVFRPWMLTERAKELDGRRIRLLGYMHGSVAQNKQGQTEFVLLRNTECKFGPGGQADHLVQVVTTKGVTAKYTDRRVEIEGVLTIHPFTGADGNTWSIYDVVAEAVHAR